MRILYICHRFPYTPNRGGKIRPFNMISHLSKNHEVHVASLAHSKQDTDEAPGIEPYCASYAVEKPHHAMRWLRMLSKIPFKKPSAPDYFYSSKLQTKIDNLISTNDFDLIFVHCAFVAQYVANVTHIPKILDFGDMDSQKWLAYADAKPFPLSIAYLLEGKKMEKYESELSRKFDCCTATTRLEYETLNSMNSAQSTSWFPNGVDHNTFCLPDSEHNYDPSNIVFVGRMDYYPNQKATQYFAMDVLPIIRKSIPDAKFVIVGANPPKFIQQLENLPGVEVTGTVPDVKDLVRNAALTVAPLDIARGTQNKILESMSLGVPVVATAQAAKGVDAIPDEHLLIADGVDETVKKVVGVLQNPELRSRLSLAGRKRVETTHSWPDSMGRLDKIIEKTLTTS